MKVDFLDLLVLSKSYSNDRFIFKLYKLLFWKKILTFSIENLKFFTFYIKKNLCNSLTNCKGLVGFRFTIDFFSEKTSALFGVTHEKLQKTETFKSLFSKVFHRKDLKTGWKKYMENVWVCGSGRAHAIPLIMVLFS